MDLATCSSIVISNLCVLDYFIICYSLGSASDHATMSFLTATTSVRKSSLFKIPNFLRGLTLHSPFRAQLSTYALWPRPMTGPRQSTEISWLIYVEGLRTNRLRTWFVSSRTSPAALTLPYIIYRRNLLYLWLSCLPRPFWSWGMDFQRESLQTSHVTLYPDLRWSDPGMAATRGCQVSCMRAASLKVPPFIMLRAWFSASLSTCRQCSSSL